MATNAISTVSSYFSRNNDGMEDDLVEIRNEDESVGQLEKKVQKIWIKTEKIKKQIKYVVGILFMFGCFTLSFLFIYFFVLFQSHSRMLTNMDSQLNGEISARVKEENKSAAMMNNLMQSQNSLEIKVKRKQDASHEHIRRMENKWTELQEVIEILARKKNAILPYEDYLNKSEVYEWEVTDLKKPVGEKTTLNYFDYRNGVQIGKRDSSVFPLFSHFGAKLQLDVQSFKIVLSLQLIDYNNTNLSISSETMPKVTYIIQSPDEGKAKDLVGVAQCYFNQTMAYQQDIFEKWVYRSGALISLLTAGGGNLSIKVYVEPPEIAQSYFSNDGVLLWRVTDYKYRKQLEREGKILYHESPYFYTSLHGYRVQVRLRFTDISGISASLAFYCGKYDANLSNKFPHKTTITIFNQEDPSKNLVFTEESFNREIRAYSYTDSSVQMNLEKTTFLEGSGYVKKDSLLVKVVIEALDEEI